MATFTRIIAHQAGAALYTLNSKHYPMDDIEVLKPY